MKLPKDLIRRRLAYVVNTHDILNYDIDFNFNNVEKHLLRSVFYKDYSYKQYHLDPDGTEVEEFESKSIMNRCRLRGVMSNKNVTRGRDLLQRIILLINSVDGHVNVNIVGIDIYKRLLIDIDIVRNGKTISMKDFILDNSNGAYIPYKNSKLEMII